MRGRRRRRYRGDSSVKGLSFSPRRRHPSPSSRNFYPSRHRNNSPSRRDRADIYSREADRSRRIERSDHLVGDSSLRAAGTSRDYDDRENNRLGLGARPSASPHKIVKRDPFGRDVNVRDARLAEYGGGDKDIVRDVVGVHATRRLYDRDMLHVDSTSMLLQRERLLAEPRKLDIDNLKDYNAVNDYITRDSGERDHCFQHQYLDESRARLLPASRPKLVSLEYGRVEAKHSGYYTLSNGSIDGIPNSIGGERSSRLTSLASQYLYEVTDKQGYYNFRDDLQLENRVRGFFDSEERFFQNENKDGNFNYSDALKFDKLGTERPVGREIYKSRNDDRVQSSRMNLDGEFNNIFSLRQSKEYVALSAGTAKENSPSLMQDTFVPSSLIRSGNGLAFEPIGVDEFSEKAHTMSARIHSKGVSIPSQSHDRVPLPEDKYDDHLYLELGRSKIETSATRSKYVEEQYEDQRISRGGALDPVVDKSYKGKLMGDYPFGVPHPSSQGQSIVDKFNACRSSYNERKRNVDMLGSGSTDLKYESGGYLGYRNMKPGERHIEVGSGQWSRIDRSDVLRSREFGSSFGRIYDSPQKSTDFSLGEPSENSPRELPRGEMIAHGASDGTAGRNIYSQVHEGMESLTKKPRLSKASRTPNDMASDSPSSIMDINSCESPSRDVKSRLGPTHSRLHVSQRLSKKCNPSVKKWPGPLPPMKHSTLPGLTKTSTKMPSRGDDSDGVCLDKDGDSLADHHLQPEPPEKSEDFKYLVQSAFFKFFKQINETTMKRKAYMEKGKVGNLKCLVCGSGSDEFPDIENLVMHAFTCKKVGLRSQHFGLHKALCVLNGWEAAKVPHSEWHRQVLPIAESAALKEDLIIWPPVLIVHNITIDNENPDERIMVSTEELNAKLKGMGYKNIIKVCIGKPANHSVMVVKFNGTLSGLQEAERLHEMYTATKLGTAELQLLKQGKNGNCSDSKLITQAEKRENILYGYVGIAEDLEKLDFDTKKRCILRSKREILTIVDAPLDKNEENGCN